MYRRLSVPIRRAVVLVKSCYDCMGSCVKSVAGTSEKLMKFDCWVQDLKRESFVDSEERTGLQ